MTNKMKQIIYSLLIASLLIVFASSCKTKQLVTQTSTTTVYDTIRDTKVIFKYHAVHDTLTIDNPCDSSGILSTFYSKISIPQGKVIIRSYNGKIQATVNIDSIVSVYEKKYRNMETSSIKLFEKIIVKTIYPSWLITALIFESLIIIAYLYFKYIFSR